MKHTDEAIRLFTEERLAITKRREVWRSGQREHLFELLEYFVEAHPIGWTMEENQDIVNFGSVYLTFGKVKSGFISDGKDLLSNGPTLHFSQRINGKILPWIEFGTIEEIAPDSKEPIFFEEFDPKEINKGLVDNIVSKFLMEIL